MLEEAKRAEDELNRKRSKPLRFDFRYFFVDVDAAHVKHLKKELIERGHRPDGKRIVLLNKRFEHVADNVIAEIRRRQPRAGRAIFLLDQRGFSRVATDLVARIFRELPAAEVILTFAADALVNHLADTPAFVRAVAPLAARGESPASHRDGRRARLTRREEGEY